MKKVLRFPVKINEWASKYDIPIVKLANDYDTFIYTCLKNDCLLAEFRDNFNLMIFEFESSSDVKELRKMIKKYDKQFEGLLV